MENFFVQYIPFIKLKEWIIKWQLGEEHEGWESREQGVELLIRTIELCAGRLIVPEIAPSKETPYDRLTYLTLSICNHIHQEMLKVKREDDYNEANTNGNLNELQMQELVQRVLDNSDDLNQDTKKTFLTIVKSFYYKAHCPSSIMDVHLSKINFIAYNKLACLTVSGPVSKPRRDTQHQGSPPTPETPDTVNTHPLTPPTALASNGDFFPGTLEISSTPESRSNIKPEDICVDEPQKGRKYNKCIIWISFTKQSFKDFAFPKGDSNDCKRVLVGGKVLVEDLGFEGSLDDDTRGLPGEVDIMKNVPLSDGFNREHVPFGDLIGVDAIFQRIYGIKMEFRKKCGLLRPAGLYRYS
ncbi:Ent-copalyl diphosphate synthase 2 [Acorus calamus]|uniref:Ent-copalyl diphosphate synthase 2 n=1 Tax=Acorus calamus TaxID=4465 RepID=A0AAV9C8Q2_ACOCL|nr:Ent-copalyl diphosphate synthase 2 [Acorus calamus]